MNLKLIKNIINVFILTLLCILHSIILMYSIHVELLVFMFYIVVTAITMFALLLELLETFNVIKQE
jgi:hypothetical protein